MKRRFLLTLLCVLVAAMGVLFSLSACSGGDDAGGDPGSSVDPGNTEDPDDPVTPTKIKADVVLFIGQSNMAGRGNAAEATVVAEGHGYEFRAISDPTKLYPLTEPFGVNENNAQSGVSENKKTGSLVSAFCESYYEATKNPIVAVSCSKGGEKISFFDTDTAVFADAVARLNAAKEYIASGAEENMELGRVFAVWLQGESDGDAGVSAADYTAALGRIVEALNAEAGVEQTFVIPIGGYHNSDYSIKTKYNTIRNAQISFCAHSDMATAVSVTLFDLYTYGYMKDNFHYTQAGYEIVGSDAGANAAYFAKTGNKPECKAFFKNVSDGSEKGAWQESGGKVVIPASAALEQSKFASFTSNGSQGNTFFTWQKYSGSIDGITQTPNSGGQWNINYAFSLAPQVHYTFELTEGGRYYLYLLTSYPDTGSNSVYASIDDGELILCNTSSYGHTMWLGGGEWSFDITAGVHTVTLYVREDGVSLNQIVLSKSSAESLPAATPIAVSARGADDRRGAYKEADGKVSINLADAFENSAYAFNSSGTSLSYPDTFKWERSAGYDGVQVMPNKGAQWSTANITPKLSYRVDFSTVGDYYAMMYTSFPDGGSDSIYLSIDDGSLLSCTSYIATGVGKWMANKAWKLNVPYAGVHTVNVFAREDGAVFHRLYLTTDGVVQKEPGYSPRYNADGEIEVGAPTGSGRIKTLIIGDSYTSKIAWRNFDRQMDEVGAETVGIGGTKVNLWQTYADDVAFYDPENLVIHIGVNDIDGGISGSDCGNSIIGLITTLKAKLPNTKIYYVSICDNEKFAPGNSGGNPAKWDDYAVSNGLVRDFVTTADGVEFIDFAAELKLKGPDMQSRFRDELHLSDEGYELFSSVIKQALSKDRSI